MVPLLGCALGVSRTAEEGARLSDGAVRSAVIKMIADSTRGPLQVDSVPLPPGLDAAGGSTSPTSEDMKSNAGMNELADIWDVAVRSAPESIRRACAGILVPYPPESAHKGCPRDPLTIVVLGRPHPATAAEVDSLRQAVSVPAGVQVVRFVNVLETTVTSRGRFTRVWEYVVAARRGEWMLVTRIPSVGIE